MFRSLAALALAIVITDIAVAVDYRVEPLNEPAPTDAIAASIADGLAKTGVRVIRGSATSFCDIWLRKELEIPAEFKPTNEVLYPFQPGQLIGVARYSRKGSDFRDQDIPSGVFTLRYAQQPVDGAHVGTSPTRDFLLLIEAKKDESPAVMEYKSLAKQSAEAAGSSHPALLAMQKVVTEAKEFPAIRHDEERDWWIVAMQAQVKAGSSPPRPLTLELVVVGVAAE